MVSRHSCTTALFSFLRVDPRASVCAILFFLVVLIVIAAGHLYRINPSGWQASRYSSSRGISRYVFGEADEGVGADKFPLHPLWSRNFENVADRNAFFVKSALGGTRWSVRTRRRVFASNQSKDWLSRYTPEELSSMNAKLKPPLFFDDQLSFLRSYLALPEELSAVVDPNECFSSLSSGGGGSEGGNANVRGVLFVGHSHVRYIATMLCVMLKGTNCEAVGDKGRHVTRVLYGAVGKDGDSLATPLPPPIVYLQSRYNSSKGIPYLLADPDVKAALPHMTHVVYGRGAWDQLYKDSVPRQLMGEIIGELERLTMGTLLPNLKKIVVYPTHYQHVYSNPSKPPEWHSHIRLCKSNARQRLSRSVGLCAARRLGAILSPPPSGKGTEDSEGNVDELTLAKPLPSHEYRQQGSARNIAVEAFDVWFLTRDEFAGVSSDLAGHHYMESVLEGLVQLLMHKHLCPQAPAVVGNRHPHFPFQGSVGGDNKNNHTVVVSFSERSRHVISPESLMAMACRRVDEASETFEGSRDAMDRGGRGLIPQCSCHNPMFEDSSACTALRGHLAYRKEW